MLGSEGYARAFTSRVLGYRGSRRVGGHCRDVQARLARCFILDCRRSRVSCGHRHDRFLLLLLQSEHACLWMADTAADFSAGYAHITVVRLYRPDDSLGVSYELH